MTLKTEEGFEISGTTEEMYSLIDRFRCSTGNSEPENIPVDEYKLGLLNAINEELREPKSQVMLYLAKNLVKQPKIVSQWYDYNRGHGNAIKDVLVGLFGEVGYMVSDKIRKYA